MVPPEKNIVNMIISIRGFLNSTFLREKKYAARLVRIKSKITPVISMNKVLR